MTSRSMEPRLLASSAISHDEYVLVVKVRNKGSRITIRKYPLMSLVKNRHTLEDVSNCFKLVSQICVKHSVAIAVAEVADNYRQVPTALEQQTAFFKDRCQLGNEPR